MFTKEQLIEMLKPLVKMALILLIGHIAITYIMKLIRKAFQRSKLDKSLANYCAKAINVILHVFVILAAFDAVGVSTSGIVAASSAAVVAIGVALKDSLSNVAGGVWLLFSPRFSTGDYISTGGDEGIVISVELLHTTLQTPDSKQVSIPNGVLVNSHITNYSIENKRRVDILFPVSYEADVHKAKLLALDTLKKHPLILDGNDTEPFVRVRSYGDSAVNLTVRAWCQNENYWDVYYDIIEDLREVFESNGIMIPYNQLDVRIQENKE